MTLDEAEEIYAMTAPPTQYGRYVLPPLQREEALEPACSPELCKGCTGYGPYEGAVRRSGRRSG